MTFLSVSLCAASSACEKRLSGRSSRAIVDSFVINHNNENYYHFGRDARSSRSNVTGSHRDSSHSPLIAAFIKHYEELVNHVRHRFGDRAFACDVVQDVGVQLLQRPPGEPVHTPLAFLRHLSIHRAIDRWRGDELHASRMEPAGVDVPDLRSDDIDGEQALSYRQTVQELERAINALPARCREVFILHKLHDLSQEEVAAQLRISRNMVAKHMARAMTDLTPILQNTLHTKTANADAA
ncbi:RNA polymerase sigma factor [Burkholderia lata]|uniref:Extracytoplasmic-function sigma-70 factor n=1 Tax=Burkholderia lata (strain ATCC 17760 / DSM 23089 / LMG 22485 / NCIMB 9086 / R18194 / 383) TaxID=482957 RepID=A0A6P2UHT2_BURL3|nr:RNA polymerase sigma factor [Burkholderia lata]VWC68788.1 extracytoplasmic-function sigma-70 factor [Burkholderia lata]